MLQVKAPRVTIQDVAALSGLPIRTVSGALRVLLNVSARSRAKAGVAAVELGYKALPGNVPASRPDLVLAAGSSIDGGRPATIELIENRRMPSAILAGCDGTAFGALLALGLTERLPSSGLPNPPTSHVLETKLMERKSTRRRR